MKNYYNNSTKTPTLISLSNSHKQTSNSQSPISLSTPRELQNSLQNKKHSTSNISTKQPPLQFYELSTEHHSSAPR